MVKNYVAVFGSGNPAGNTGLSPTFIVFVSVPGGSLITAPGITEIPIGTGIYAFQYAPTLPIAFVLDGGGSLPSGDRFVRGILDPIQAVDNKVGFDFDSYGGTASDPTTLIGWAKRNQEFDEGNATFNKTTGAWDIYSRGSSTLLTEKILQNVTGDVTKT